MARLGPSAVREMARAWLVRRDLLGVDAISPAAGMRAAGFRLHSSYAQHLAGMTVAGERVAFVGRGGDPTARHESTRHEFGHVIQFDAGVPIEQHCEASCDPLGLYACLPPLVFAEALQEVGPDVRALRQWYLRRSGNDVSERDLALRIALQLGGYALERGGKGALRVLWADAANDIPLPQQFRLSQLSQDAWAAEVTRDGDDGSLAIPYRDRSERLRVVVVVASAA